MRGLYKAKERLERRVVMVRLRLRKGRTTGEDAAGDESMRGFCVLSRPSCITRDFLACFGSGPPALAYSVLETTEYGAPPPSDATRLSHSSVKPQHRSTPPAACGAPPGAPSCRSRRGAPANGELERAWGKPVLVQPHRQALLPPPAKGPLRRLTSTMTLRAFATTLLTFPTY